MMPSTSRAIATFCGYGMPWLMIVLSSATTGRAVAQRASATSSVSSRAGCGVMGLRQGGRRRASARAGSGQVGAHGLRHGHRQRRGRVAEPRGVRRRRPASRRVAERGQHGVAGAGDVGDRAGHGGQPERPSPSVERIEPAGPSRTQTCSTPRVVQARRPRHADVVVGRAAGQRAELGEVGGDREQRAAAARAGGASRRGLGHADRVEHHGRAGGRARASSAGREGRRSTGCRRGRAARPRPPAAPTRRTSSGSSASVPAMSATATDQLAVGVEDRDVGAGRPVGADDVRRRPRRPRRSRRAAARPASSRPTAATRLHRRAEPGEVLGDVAADPAAPSGSRCRGCWWRARPARLRARTSTLAPPMTTAPERWTRERHGAQAR